MSAVDDDAARGLDDGAGPAPESPTGKLAAQVARRIEADVLRRGWPVGESLGSEPQLRERFGVSRAILREAVRLVEHHQVARMRRGPGGGLFITAPDAGPATGAMVIYLEYVGTSVEDLMHARALIEPLAATLAADRMPEQGIDRLRTALDRERAELGGSAEPSAAEPSAGGTAAGGTAAGRTAAGVDRALGEPVHILLAGLSGNPVLELFVDVLTRLTSRYAHGAGAVPDIDRHQLDRLVLHHHAAVVDAVVAGDSGRAATLMGACLDDEADWLSRHHAGVPGAAPATSGSPVGDRRAKLAEVIAARIREDITARGWPVDAVLGSEADLLAHYGISRAVLREAVRLLEYHAVARMRRGPGGGLVVTRPDPQASIDTIALYLEFRRVGGDELRMVRDAIELGALDRVLAGSAGPLAEPAAQQLRAAVAHITDGPPETAGAADLFHFQLAELAGNPVLVLFLRIITELYRTHLSAQATPAPTRQEAAAEIRAVHQRILDAVLAGDGGRARHRMRRHLEALTAFWH